MRLVLPLLASLLLVACTTDNDKDGFDSKVDCNDNNPEINPDATELCNDLDDDCDGAVDEDAGATWFLDADGDSFGDEASTTTACEQPTGYVALDGDCDDSDDRFHPGATEDDCSDPNDYNCDGSVGYEDADSDGFPACEDCNDAAEDVFPGATEVCDEVDNDCDNLVDAQDPDIEGASTWFLDYDGDTYGSSTISELACSQPEHYVANADDCDDLRAESYPGAPELCDGYDNDCDTYVDEDSAEVETFWADLDADGYGDPDGELVACAAPDDYVTNALDCDDTQASVNPGADEVCDSIDNDCDHRVDDDDDDVLYAASDLWFGDNDEDGYGSPDITVLACDGPEGFVANNDDCDDADNDVNPDAVEVCDGIDNDCNEGADEASAIDTTTWYLDNDGDDYGQTDATRIACTQPAGYSPVPDDCDDTSDAVNPRADEICNDGVDNNCDDTFDSCTLGLGSATVTLLGANSLDDAGVSVSPAGDVNGDGYDDFLVGARDNDDAGTDAGAAYLLFGPVEEGAVELGSTGVTFTGADGGDKFGRSLRGGTDVDGDGIPDPLISAPSDEVGATAAGAVYLFSGATLADGSTYTPADALHTWLGKTSYDYLGVQVTGYDLTGDGQGDVLMSATGDDGGGTNAGAIFLVAGPVSAGTTDFGSGGTYTAKILGQAANDGVGQVLAAGLDVDGDGVGDLVVGLGKDSTASTSAGAVWIVAGPIAGSFSLADADAKVLGATSGGQLGAGVTLLGDQDGDGYDELVGGATLEATAGSDAGAAYVVPGTGSLGDLDGQSVAAVAVATIYGDASGDQLGDGLSGRGDFDGDGTNDLLVGGTGGGTTNQGAAYLYYGPVSGTLAASQAAGIFVGEAANDSAGGVVGWAGDVNGEGRDIPLISARLSDRAGTDAGAVYMIFELGL